MKLFQSYELLETSKLSHQLNSWSLAVFIALLVGASVLVDLCQISVVHFAFMQDALCFFGGYLAIALAHEGVHGGFFKLFAPEKKVVFRRKRGLSYATSPGSYFSKRQYGLITLAPFLLLTLTGVCFLALVGAYFWAGLLLITHTASCVGDFYWLSLVLRGPKNAMVKDTVTGLALYLPVEK